MLPRCQARVCMYIYIAGTILRPLASWFVKFEETSEKPAHLYLLVRGQPKKKTRVRTGVSGKLLRKKRIETRQANREALPIDRTTYHNSAT